MKGNFFGGSSLLMASFTWVTDVNAAEWLGAIAALLTAAVAAYFYYWHGRLKQAEIKKIEEETKDLKER